MSLNGRQKDIAGLLAEWREVTDKATPGPWVVGDHDHIQGASHCECRPSYGPLVWEGRRDINGTRTLAHIHRQDQSTWDDDTSIYSTELPYPEAVALSTSEYGSISPENAESIAVSRTAMPALLTAVENVLKEHEESWSCGNPRHTNPEVGCPDCWVECGACGCTYPCPTVVVIRDALGGA